MRIILKQPLQWAIDSPHVDLLHAVVPGVSGNPVSQMSLIGRYPGQPSDSALERQIRLLQFYLQ